MSAYAALMPAGVAADCGPHQSPALPERAFSGGPKRALSIHLETRASVAKIT